MHCVHAHTRAPVAPRRYGALITGDTTYEALRRVLDVLPSAYPRASIRRTLRAWRCDVLGRLLGLVTGALCVKLVVRRSIWNWPTGLANNVVYLVLFWQAGLYADAGLQVI